MSRDDQMGCHRVEAENDQQYREDNDNPFDVDEETQLLNNIKLYWRSEEVDGLTPSFYLYEQVKTHDLSTGPYVVVYYVTENNIPYGLGYPTVQVPMFMTVEFRTLTRPQLFKMKRHIIDILHYIRKMPFMDYDLMMGIQGRRIEAEPGTFAYAIDIQFKDFVRPINSTRWE